MTVRDARAHLAELYATDVSPDLISRVTDAVLDAVREWQDRPLDPVYPVVFFDALRVKIRDEGLVKNKAVYVALALNPDGEKDVLGAASVASDAGSATSATLAASWAAILPSTSAMRASALFQRASSLTATRRFAAKRSRHPCPSPADRDHARGTRAEPTGRCRVPGPRRNQADGFLHAAVWAVSRSDRLPSRSHRRADDKFAAARFLILISGRERTLPQQIKLVLVEVALQSSLLINQHSVDHAAHLEQLLPIPAVTSKAGDLARRDGANLAEAHLRYHPLEAGALDTARSRTAEIVIDHLDLRPAERGQTIAHGILQRAVLAIVQNHST